MGRHRLPDGQPATAEVLSARRAVFARALAAVFWAVLLLLLVVMGTHGYSHFRGELAGLQERRDTALETLRTTCASSENAASPYVYCRDARLHANADIVAIAAEHTAAHLLSDINIFAWFGRLPGMEANGVLRYMMLQAFSWAVTLWIPVALLAFIAVYGLGANLMVGPLLKAWRAWRHKRDEYAAPPQVAPETAVRRNFAPEANGYSFTGGDGPQVVTAAAPPPAMYGPATFTPYAQA